MLFQVNQLGATQIQNTGTVQIQNTGTCTITPNGDLTLKNFKMLGEIDMKEFKIVDVATPTQPKDAANKAYVDGKGTLTTKGDLYVSGVNGFVSRLPVGPNGSVLTADSSTTLGVRWALPNATAPAVILIATNIGSQQQAQLQAYYDGTTGFLSTAPNTVPTEVTNADTGNAGGVYTVYLGHNIWSYRQNSTGSWVEFGSGGKSAFGGDIAKLYTYK